MARTTFLSLSTELRYQIYSHILRNDEEQSIDNGSRIKSTAELVAGWRYSLEPLSNCRKLVLVYTSRLSTIATLSKTFAADIKAFLILSGASLPTLEYRVGFLSVSKESTKKRCRIARFRLPIWVNLSPQKRLAHANVLLSHMIHRIGHDCSCGYHSQNVPSKLKIQMRWEQHFFPGIEPVSRDFHLSNKLRHLLEGMVHRRIKTEFKAGLSVALSIGFNDGRGLQFHGHIAIPYTSKESRDRSALTLFHC